MEWLISVRAYEWRGLYLRGPVKMEWLISVRAYKWRDLYLRGPINGGTYI